MCVFVCVCERERERKKEEEERVFFLENCIFGKVSMYTLQNRWIYEIHVLFVQVFAFKIRFKEF